MALARTILSAIALAAACAAPALAKPVLHLADLRKIVSVSSPQISPDGTRAAYYVTRRDYQKNKAVVDLMLIDLHARASRPLLRGVAAAGFAWAPNGGSIAYIGVDAADADKNSQLFVLPMNGGEPLQLTHEKKGVVDFAWRPDSRAIAYAATGEAPNAKAIEAHDDAFDVTDEAWTAQAAPVPPRLLEIPAGGGTAHAIPSWKYFVDGFTYSADGRALFVTRTKPDAHPNRYLATELVRVDVRSGATAKVQSPWTSLRNATLSRDGRYLAYSFANPQGPMQSEIALAGPNGEHPRFLTQRLDRNPSEIHFAHDDAVITLANDKTQVRIYRLDPSGDVSSYDIGSMSAFAADAAPDGTLVFTGATLDRPPELYALAPHAKVPVRLTHYNDWITGYAIGEARAVAWQSGSVHPDGVLIAPPGHQRGQKAPLVLVIHGGPTSASNTAFSGFAQVLAAHGWYVFEPNYRGSDNLGLEFARTTVPHIASVPGDDIEAGVAAVLKVSDADPARMAVSGWSEGGLMTSWLIGHDARWKAAVSGAAVNEWLGYSAMTDAKDFTPQFIGPSPWANPALLSTFDAESPLTYALDVKTPTLILSDAGDFRVPTPLSYEFYHSVRATGTPVEFVIFPVNGHFPSDPIRSEDVYRRWEAWLAKYL